MLLILPLKKNICSGMIMSGDDVMKRTIFHIDVNSAFLSWEAVYRIHHLGGQLDLRNIPSAVAGDMAMRRGIILAKSIPAKKYGVKTGETIWEAKKKCPRIELVPPNYSLYEACSEALLSYLREYTPAVEQYSVDEAFMDMTGTEKLWGDPVALAYQIKENVKKRFGFTVNIGVSSNKILAKMASDFRKPDCVHTLFPEEIKEKMWPLPVDELFFVGRASRKKLHTLGINTIGELANADRNLLRAHLKSHGELIRDFANGYDDSEVLEKPMQHKGYGNSTTIAFDVEDADMAKHILLALAETVASRLRRAKVKASVISVTIKSSELRSVSHQAILETATDITNELYETAARLFDELWYGQPIRHLGIHVTRLRDQDEVRQMELFDDRDYEKLERADQAIDRIRLKHGIDAVKRAAFIKSPIDHMSGGISREKRTVDYEKLVIR